MYTAKEIADNFRSIPTIEEREYILRSTAEQWASDNNKNYCETVYTPINELRNGFLYYLSNTKPQNYYESIYVAMREYFGDNSSSGINFFTSK